MKISARLFWIFIIFLLIAEIIIFRQAISYHTTGNRPQSIADNQPLHVNRYVSLPAALQATPPLVFKAPGYKIHIYQHRGNKNIFIYDLGNSLSAKLEKMTAAATVEGRLLQLKDAPFSAEVRSHFATAKNTPAYALLLNVKPQKSIFYLYLAAILLTFLLVVFYPFLGKVSNSTF